MERKRGKLKMTERFIELCQNDYGGEIIKQLKGRYESED